LNKINFSNSALFLFMPPLVSIKNFTYYILGIAICFGGAGSMVLAADEKLVFENEQIKLQLFPRTPNQMAGFYEAREFPKEMVDVLTDFCIMTAVIHNKTKDVFWMDLDSWKFTSGSGGLQRVHRNQWPPRWKKINIPMASQSTFRWTLLPESLEFFPDEHEGGNVILVSTRKSFSLQASFAVGENKDMGSLVARINNIRCAKDGAEEVSQP
jgi:hypothetical protein